MDDIEYKYDELIEKIFKNYEEDVRIALHTMDEKYLIAFGIYKEEIDSLSIEEIVTKIYFVYLLVQEKLEDFEYYLYELELPLSEITRVTSERHVSKGELAILEAQKHYAIYYIIDALNCRENVMNAPNFSDRVKCAFVDRLIEVEDRVAKEKIKTQRKRKKGEENS